MNRKMSPISSLTACSSFGFSFSDWAGVFQRKFSMSSAASIVRPSARFFGLWNCCQSLSSLNLSAFSISFFKVSFDCGILCFLKISLTAKGYNWVL